MSSSNMISFFLYALVTLWNSVHSPRVLYWCILDLVLLYFTSFLSARENIFKKRGQLLVNFMQKDQGKITQSSHKMIISGNVISVETLQSFQCRGKLCYQSLPLSNSAWLITFVDPLIAVFWLFDWSESFDFWV